MFLRDSMLQEWKEQKKKKRKKGEKKWRSEKNDFDRKMSKSNSTMLKYLLFNFSVLLKIARDIVYRKIGKIIRLII